MKKNKQAPHKTTKALPLGKGSLDSICEHSYELSRFELRNMYLSFVNPNASEFELDLFDIVPMKKLIAYSIWVRVKSQKGRTKWLDKIAKYVQLAVQTLRCLLIPKKPKNVNPKPQ